MFFVNSGCSSLTSLDLSKFDTRNVEKMTEMFKNCESLTSLDISNFETSNVENMKGMFAGCKNLRYLDISSFGGYGETNGMLSGVPSSGRIRVSKRFVDTVQRYLPKKWQVELSDMY